MANGFEVNHERFFAFLDKIRRANSDQIGIFRQDIKPFFPEYNLPEELEYSPRQTKTKKPYEASLWLFTRLFCDRRMQSGNLIKRVNALWQDRDKQWIFHPEKVLQRCSSEIEGILKKDLKFTLSKPNEKTNGKRYCKNAKRLVEDYRADPKNLIQNRTYEEAISKISSLEGLGREMAKLLIKEYMAREIALPSDPENATLKVDTHKMRTFLNTGSLDLKGETSIHLSALTGIIENAFRNYCRERELSYHEIISLDDSWWVIGSEVCRRNSHKGHCSRNCPLSLDDCISRVGYDKSAGRFIVFDSQGKRIEVRSDLQGTSQRQDDFLNKIY